MTSPAPRETTPGDRRAGLMLPAILVSWTAMLARFLKRPIAYRARARTCPG